MYSVAFVVKDNKKYYNKHREKYHLDQEDAVLEEIPQDTTDKMPYYYWDGESWQFDESSYYKDQNEKEAQAAEEENKQEEEAELAISQEDLINAITEMAQIISDLQEQVNKLSGVEE